MIDPTQNLDHEALEMDNQNHCRKVSNPAKLNCALKDDWQSFIFS